MELRHDIPTCTPIKTTKPPTTTPAPPMVQLPTYRDGERGVGRMTVPMTSLHSFAHFLEGQAQRCHFGTRLLESSLNRSIEQIDRSDRALDWEPCILSMNLRISSTEPTFCSCSLSKRPMPRPCSILSWSWCGHGHSDDFGQHELKSQRQGI